MSNVQIGLTLVHCCSVFWAVWSGVAPELVKQENLLHSIAAALHLSTQPITGQTATPAQLQRNAAVSVNVEQPLMQVSSRSGSGRRRGSGRGGGSGGRDGGNWTLHLLVILPTRHFAYWMVCLVPTGQFPY